MNRALVAEFVAMKKVYLEILFGNCICLNVYNKIHNSVLVLSALFYFLSWKLYKPLPTASKLLDEDCHPADSRNSVTISNITEGTIVEDCDTSIQNQSLINRSPLFIYESSI